MEQEYDQIVTAILKKSEVDAQSLDKIKDGILFAQNLGNKKPSVKLWNKLFVSNLQIDDKDFS